MKTGILKFSKLSTASITRGFSLYGAADWSLVLYCLWFSLSIAASQLFLVLFLVFTLCSYFREWSEDLQGGVESGNILARIRNFFSLGGSYTQEFYAPLFVWIVVAMGASLLGLNPSRSFTQIAKLLVYFLIPVCMLIFVRMGVREGYSRVSQIEKFLIVLFLGQAIAAVHTIFSGYFGFEVRPKIPGPLTESGQIVLLFPLLIGMLHFRLRGQGLQIKKKMAFSFALVFCPLVLFAWHDKFSFMSDSLAVFLAILSFVVVFNMVLPLFRDFKLDVLKNRDTLVPVLATLIFIAFILNLKRGPWLAVAVEVLVFGLLFSRFTMVTFLVVMLLCAFIPPVTERIVTFAEHFFIGGGRYDMWKLGFQLIERFPLGIGFGNSNLMREFDPTLPLLHRHMHNNVLNMALEVGILGAVAYVWWFVHFIVKGFRLYLGKCLRYSEYVRTEPQAIYVVLILISIIGWQIAGLVEYNFGDGEIRLLALVLIGFLLSAASPDRTR